MNDFDEIYSKYHRQVYNYLLKLCGSEDIAEEITQETFFKVLKSIDSYKGECKLSVWMCQIAKNTYLNYMKKQKRTVSDIPEELSDGFDLENMILDRQMAARIHELLHELDEPYREVFWMRTFGELPFVEIARIHGKSENWARVTYHRAKIKIREELE